MYLSLIKKFSQLSVKSKVWIGVYAFCALAIIVILIKFRSYFLPSLHQSDPWLLLIGFVFMALQFLCMGICWYGILYFLEQHHKFAVIQRLFFISQIVRYIPGNVWSFMARFYWHRQLGMEKKIITFGIGIEIGLQLITACIISACSVLIDQKTYLSIIQKYIGLSQIGLFLLILLGVCVLFAFTRKFVPKKLTISEYLTLTIGYFLYWVLFGLGFFFICQAFHVSKDFPLLLGMNTIAWLIGYLSIITPSGIGVREAVTVALLTLVGVNPAIAFLIAIVSRIAFILSEALDTFIFIFLR